MRTKWRAAYRLARIVIATGGNKDTSALCRSLRGVEWTAYCCLAFHRNSNHDQLLISAPQKLAMNRAANEILDDLFPQRRVK